jgi:hypothetical protein
MSTKPAKTIVTIAILGGLAYYFYPKKQQTVDPAIGETVKAKEEPMKFPEWPEWLLKAGEENIEKLKEDKPVVNENPMTYQDFINLPNNLPNIGQNQGNPQSTGIFSGIDFKLGNITF